MDQDDSKNIDSLYEIIDPDYESTNTAIRRVELQEEEENKLTEDKLRTIIQEEFDKELQIRQKQLEEIEEKVFKAQKLLHVVRYVLISSYYNSKALEYESANESKLDPSNVLADQNRIHPAVKKLLGNNTSSLKFLAPRTKRKATISHTETSTEAQCEPKKIKLEKEDCSENSISMVGPIKIEPQIPKTVEEPVMNRKKVQHRIVIGNISYYKKSLQQNNLTHKWMVYVKIFRGLKDGPELTNLITDKVVFHLHPSYKPHDVVEISQPPFHLTRRGWGEFPLRVKIHFKSSMNKPVDVIHQLKLDNTFMERQTLGNQTTVPIFLYDDSPKPLKQEPIDKHKVTNEKLNNNNFTTIGNSSTFSILNDQIISIEPIKSEPTTSYEHDYCYDNVTIKQEVVDIIDDYTISEECEVAVLNQAVQHEKINCSIRDHAYNLPADKEGQKSPKKHKSPVKQAYNELIYGLGPHYLDPVRSRARSVRPKVIEKVNTTPEKNAKSVVKVLKTVTGQSIRFLPESFNQVLLNNGSIVSVKFLKSPSSSSKNVHKGVINLESRLSNNCAPANWSLVKQKRQLLKLPKHTFKSMGEVLSYLFKRLPLWTNNTDYKSTYLFAASSEKEYSSWNVGKKLASEWSRAKTIKRIVSGEPYSKNWTTKAIFMYGRSHLYTPPVPSYRLFTRDSLEKQLILNSFQYNNRLQNGYSSFPIDDSDEAINITSPVKPVINSYDSNSIDTCIDISDNRLSQECAYVKEVALDVGVILKPEVLVKGVSMNASERIILEAVKCFAENLIRRSRNYLICQPNFDGEASEISVNAIKKVLDERKEFQSIKTFKENKLRTDFFS